jgi:hypothetical protein
VSSRRIATAALGVLPLVLLASCGKKGPPLEPLRLAPAAVGELTARRTAQQVELRFVLPTTNLNGPGVVDMDRVEVYAITVGPGSGTPPNRDLLTKARVVGTIPIRPAPAEGEPDPPATDTRPGPGDRITFVEQLSEDKLKPVPGPPRPPSPEPPAPGAEKPAAEKPGPSTPGAEKKTTPEPAAAAPDTPDTKPQPPVPPTATPDVKAPVPAPAGPLEPTRIYVVRGLSRSGRPGAPSGRIAVPLSAPVAPPSAVVALMPTENALSVEWTPPVAEPGSSPLAYNVYRRETPTAPLNQAPMADVKFETPPGELGKEQCFVLRTIQTIQNVTIESEPSAPACLTPVDRFPPAAPTGLRAVAEDGAISIVWDPNAEADLGGYLILRGEAPGDTLQPLTPKPIVEANFRDTAVTPGVRYVYAIVAVDRATPANSSAQSASEAVTAR